VKYIAQTLLYKDTPIIKMYRILLNVLLQSTKQCRYIVERGIIINRVEHIIQYKEQFRTY